MSYSANKNELLIVGASTTDTSGRYIEVSNCDILTATFVVSVSAATLSATFSIGGTNDNPEVSSFPVLTNGTVITTLPGTYTYTNGVLTIANQAIGTSEVTVSFSRFPKWVRASYTYTSGGGTVDAKVIASAWSV
jgi:hypothetical protein